MYGIGKVRLLFGSPTRRLGGKRQLVELVAPCRFHHHHDRLVRGLGIGTDNNHRIFDILGSLRQGLADAWHITSADSDMVHAKLAISTDRHHYLPRTLLLRRGIGDRQIQFYLGELAVSGGEHQKETKIEIARIAKNGNGNDQEPFSLEKKKVADFKESKNTYPVSVAIEEKLDGTQNYRFYCNNKEFSELEFGDQIFDAVCNQILMLRKNQEKYPIYITDIDLSRLSERQEIQMCHYLQKKFALEFKINQLVNKGLPP